ncbi:MAG: hypothetical protein Q7W45_01940 [Bacteroidota bacterium]|nr:hypothetical protein [Bacteroidota bacterium]MDP3146596.1 hypothetical protein [Bacteroidota bacterium]MDP3556250.1 hypothetical protein [Bacteroidota bacterium]
MKKIKNLSLLALLLISSVSCKKSETEPEPVVTPVTTPTPIGAITLDCTYSNGLTLTNHNKNGVDYIVNCDLEVVGGKLSIDTNVIIQFGTQGSLTVKNNAYIEAIGSATKSIVFEGATNATSSWKGIWIESEDTRNKFNYCKIVNGGDYAGAVTIFGSSSYQDKANIHVEGKLAVTNSTITGSGGSGMIYNSNATVQTFSNNIISNNNGYPIVVYGGSLSNLSLQTCTFTSNTKNYIGLYSVSSNQEITQTVVINNSPIPYYTINDLNFQNNLEIKPGVSLVMGSSNYIAILGTGYAKLIGTMAQPIILKGEVNTAGFWDGIWVNTNNALNEFNYVNISDGGNEAAALFGVKANISVGSAINTAQLKIGNSTSTNFIDCAIAVANGSSIVNTTTITVPSPCTY